MARITTEDCIDKVDNRFELVAIAAKRAKDISSGAQLTIERDNDKNTVVALREIAAGTVKVSEIREQLIKGQQHSKKIEAIEDDNLSAETENNPEVFDYLPDNQDLYITEDQSDLDNDEMFEDDDTLNDGDEKGF